MSEDALPGQPPEKTPDPSPQPPQEAPVPPAAKDPSARAGELQAELDQIRAEAVPGEKVMLRVMPPHDSFTYGGIVVGADPAPVPGAAVPRLMSAAGDAGVTLEEA